MFTLSMPYSLPNILNLNALSLMPNAFSLVLKIKKFAPTKPQKNWRLGGKKVKGDSFKQVKEGDYFLCTIDLQKEEPHELFWTVVIQSLSCSLHKKIQSIVDDTLTDGMEVFIPTDEEFSQIPQAIKEHSQNLPDESVTTPQPPTEIKKPPQPRKLTVKERLQHPNILSEMMRVSLALSSAAQKDFLTVLETTAEEIRTLLLEAGLIKDIELCHRDCWASVKGKPLSFIDGGTASLSTLGAEPIAIRVGSYTVIPGKKEDREKFSIEKQLVDELFETTNDGGLFDDIYDDTAKLRDVARFTLELAGALAVKDAKPSPEYIFIHGTLINPVSSYALPGFPNFTANALEKLLPKGERERTGRDANFVSVYLRQLQLLQESDCNVCGVSERASSSQIVTGTLLNLLHEQSYIDATTLKEFKEYLTNYRISDAVLFHCILNEGEYIEPIAADRNTLRKAPEDWKPVIKNYPMPMLTYVSMGVMSLPLKVEFFENPPAGYEQIIRLVIHSCRLMPQYAFPAGLDIVDKFAKVPNWMSRPINNTLAVQFMKKAMDTGNPMLIEEAKRMLCGTTRDWLFRPSYNS